MKLSETPIPRGYFALFDDYGQSARIYRGYKIFMFMGVAIDSNLDFTTDFDHFIKTDKYYVDNLDMLFQDTLLALMDKKDDDEYRYQEDIGMWQIRDDIAMYKIHSGSSSFRNFVRNLCEEFEEDVQRLGKVFTGTSDAISDKIYSMAMGDGKNLADLIMKFVDSYDADDLEKFEFYTRDSYWARNRKEVCLRRLINKVQKYTLQYNGRTK